MSNAQHPSRTERYAAEVDAYAAENPDVVVSGVPIARIAAHIREGTQLGITLLDAFEMLDAPPEDRRAFLEREWAALCAKHGFKEPFPLPPLRPESVAGAPGA